MCLLLTCVLYLIYHVLYARQMIRIIQNTPKRRECHERIEFFALASCWETRDIECNVIAVESERRKELFTGNTPRVLSFLLRLFIGAV